MVVGVPKVKRPEIIKKGGCDYWESHWPTDTVLLGRAVRNAVPVPVQMPESAGVKMERRRYGRPRWAHVMDLFSCGSTVAHGLCRRFGLNPDDMGRR